MRRVFADTNYWVAIIHLRDQWHVRAGEVSRRLGPVLLVTTDEVLGEFLAHFSGYGAEMRRECALTIRELMTNLAIEIIPQSRDSFLAGLTLYEARPDKGYSLTDCISMAAMRDRRIAEVLTHDVHFAQEGFVLLL